METACVKRHGPSLRSSASTLNAPPSGARDADRSRQDTRSALRGRGRLSPAATVARTSAGSDEKIVNAPALVLAPTAARSSSQAAKQAVLGGRSTTAASGAAFTIAA